MPRVFWSAAVLAACLTAAPSLQAQAPRPPTLVDLAELPRVLDAQLSPDGRSVAYVLNRADWRANRAVGQIWCHAIEGPAPSQLTQTEGGANSPRWSPDSASLLFLAPGAPDGLQIYVAAARGGAPRQLSRHAGGTAQPSWSPDGAVVFFVASDPPTAEERERERLRDDVFAFEENFKQRHLWTIDVATGGERQLTSGSFSVLSYRVSRDGRRIVTHRAPTPLSDAGAVASEIWVMPSSGEPGVRLTDNRIEEIEAELSPDNSAVLFLAQADRAFQPYYTAKIFVVPSAGGRAEALLTEYPHAIERAAWAPDGRSILAVANMGVHSEIVRIWLDQGRRVEPLTNGRHSVQFWSLAPSAGRMVFQLDEPNRPGDVWTLGVGETQPKRVSAVYDTLARDLQLPRQERVAWNGTDGVSVEGILFYPASYEKGRRYPLVVQLHGGPAESDKFGFGPGVIVNYVPVLASRGYAVLRPNYRGSAGYGDAFLRDIVGRYFRNMHRDVLAGVDHLIREGIADPERLAVMGWSAGGHLTNKLITVTNRFKAASSSAGMANWTSFFAQTDLRSPRTVIFGGTPWDRGARMEAFWSDSPIKDAAAVRTPTLFVIGQQDPRVPLAQSVEMHRALRANGVSTRLWVAPREGHQWSELRHQLFKANVELEWFERYVMDRSYTWEAPPGDGR